MKHLLAIVILFGLFAIPGRSQVIGVYTGGYYTTHNSGENQDDFTTGPVLGIRASTRSIRSVQLGIDFSHFGKTYRSEGVFYQETRTPQSDTIVEDYTSFLRKYRASTCLLELYFSSPDDDTFGLAVGLKGGLTYFVYQAEFGNARFTDIKSPQFVPNLGLGGRFYRNYLFGTPLQFFVGLEAYTMIIRIQRHDLLDGKPAQKYPLHTGQAKIGLAYKFH